ncbi:hypothetical protein B2G50_16360 [Leptospira interrogans serovar Canicola]|nr:hypothetical protein B2G50_16360 [Leptospira interrogans serovar Canicola]
MDLLLKLWYHFFKNKGKVAKGKVLKGCSFTGFLKRMQTEIENGTKTNWTTMNRSNIEDGTKEEN